MRKFAIKAVSFGILAATLSPQLRADSCYDLWYARNLIYAQNGYCFSTSLGRWAFADYQCWTSSINLSPSEQRRVAKLKAQERRSGCKVNR